MQNDWMIHEGRMKSMLAEEKCLRRERERKTKRILNRFCAADRRLEKIAAAWKRPPRWGRSAWTRRQNNRWAAAAGARERLAKELLKIGGR